MNNDLLKLLQDTKDSMINGFSKISDNPTYEYVLCGVEMSFDKILKIVRFYDDVINSKWIKFSDACPEDFNLDWVNGSCRIDELPKDGEKDIHGDYGDYCYKGFRHSLCHGWSAGVLQFIKEEC